MKSPANPSKKTQVHYTDSLGDMYANTVKIYYEYQSNKMVPKKIVLEGQVKLYNHTKENSKHPIRQYALANRVLLYPEQQKVYLYAEDNQRVYYLDDINHTKLSAPFITLERSENNNPRIKAKGHVTDFSQEQEKHIKDIFE